MKAMVLEKTCRVTPDAEPLRLAELPIPSPGTGELLLKVSCCGVCHTELDEIEGRMPLPRLPLVLGHQVVGHVVARGTGTGNMGIGTRLGVAWIYSACQRCEFCRSGQENLCPEFRATGRDADGGFAEYMVVPEGFVFPIPDAFTDAEAAPLLCAGAIGYRSLRLTGLTQGQRLGLTGFGASGHLVLKMVRHLFPESPVYVFARSPEERQFALDLGAVWAGNTCDIPPENLDAVIDTTPAWKPVLAALRVLKPGGRLVINAIRKEPADRHLLADIDYAGDLWMEREIKSVANVARKDVAEFLDLAAKADLRPKVRIFPLIEANKALRELRDRNIRGARVLSLNADESSSGRQS